MFPKIAQYLFTGTRVAAINDVGGPVVLDNRNDIYVRIVVLHSVDYVKSFDELGHLLRHWESDQPSGG